MTEDCLKKKSLIHNNYTLHSVEYLFILIIFIEAQFQVEICQANVLSGTEHM